jgi:hypothetical protein
MGSILEGHYKLLLCNEFSSGQSINSVSACLNVNYFKRPYFKWLEQLLLFISYLTQKTQLRLAFFFFYFALKNALEFGDAILQKGVAYALTFERVFA